MAEDRRREAAAAGAEVYRLDFATEPPKIGPQYTTLVPAVYANGHDVAGIRLPAIAVPLATYTRWNYRHPSTGAATEFAGETGSIFPLAKRYKSKAFYLMLYRAAAEKLIRDRFLLRVDMPDLLEQGSLFFETFAGVQH